MQIEYERGFLKAPLTGMVNHLFVDEGEFVDKGKPFADVVNVDKIKINVNVPELDVRYLKAGQTTVVRVDAFQDRELTGVIDFVAYKADPATKTFHVKVTWTTRIICPAGDDRPCGLSPPGHSRRSGSAHFFHGEEQADRFTGRFAPPETFVPLTVRLMELGYSERDLGNILGGNWYRVAKQVWK